MPIQTKYLLLYVICSSCSKDQFMILTNKDKHKCDVCGRIRNKVTYADLDEFNNTLAKDK